MTRGAWAVSWLGEELLITKIGLGQPDICKSQTCRPTAANGRCRDWVELRRSIA